MSDYTKYTKQEMQAYAIAKNIKENQIVIVGTGLPLIGASLAKRAVCPSCHPIVESGLMDCSPVEVPRSVGDNRFMAHCAVQWPNIRFVGFEANEWLHDTDRLVAFIGGAQIDRLAELFANITNIKVNVANEPEESAVRGLLKIVSEPKYKRLLFQIRNIDLK